MLTAANWTARLNELATRARLPGVALGIWSDRQEILAAHGVLNSRPGFRSPPTPRSSRPVKGPVTEWFRTHECDNVMTLSGRVPHSLNRAGYFGGRVMGVMGRGAVSGIAGPAVFTGAWIVSSLLQTGHRAVDLQISGLAAPDARDPWIMIAGFLVLGGCIVAFGAELHDALGGRDHAGPAPRLIQGAGVLTIAAGLLRRDHMLLSSGSVSWHNHAHDVISAVIYVDLVLAQLLLAARFGRDREWRAWRPWLLASAGVTTVLLIAFAAGTSAPGAGFLQRAAVTIPLAVITAIATRLSRNPARLAENRRRLVKTPGTGG